MRSHMKNASPTSEVITSALTAGTTSLSGASLTNTGAGPNPAIPSSSTQPTSGPHNHNHNPNPTHPRKEGFFTQWKKLLGLDTFVAIAFGTSSAGARRQRRKNAFSR
ncbi:MAG: hypothetical protein Q9218_003837, partial [Villophora microphyllina]